jgi:P-type conjugative transfer protein TrbJ
MAMKLVPILVVAATLCARARDANAQAAVFDASTFGQSLATALNTANQVKQFADQLANMRQQLQYEMQALKTLDPASLSSVLNLYNQSMFTYNNFQADASSIGFGVANVNASYNKLFAKPAAIKSAQAADYENMYGLWQVELQNSSQTAIRAQANAGQLQQNAAATQKILAASRGADGEVRQLQLVVQSLAVIQSQLTTLTETISTAERVNATAAAATATEKIIAREQARRSRDQYRNLGRPVTVLKKLP